MLRLVASRVFHAGGLFVRLRAGTRACFYPLSAIPYRLLSV